MWIYWWPGKFVICGEANGNNKLLRLSYLPQAKFLPITHKWSQSVAHRFISDQNTYLWSHMYWKIPLKWEIPLPWKKWKIRIPLPLWPAWETGKVEIQHFTLNLDYHFHSSRISTDGFHLRTIIEMGKM